MGVPSVVTGPKINKMDGERIHQFNLEKKYPKGNASSILGGTKLDNK